MSKRICDKCGKEKNLSGGKTCENGHFFCSSCISGGFFGSDRSTCYICKKKLR